MKLSLLVLMALFIQNAYGVGTHGVPGFTGEISECEERLLGNQSMQRLLQALVQRNANDVVAYRIFMRAKQVTSSYLRDLPDKEKSIEAFGVRFNFEEVRIAGMGGRLLLDFELSGQVRNVVQAVMELTDPVVQERFDLFPFSYAVVPEEVALPKIAYSATITTVRKRLADLNLSSRTLLVLTRAGLNYVGDIVSKTAAEFRQVPALGPAKFDEVESELARLHVSFGMNIPGWPFADLVQPGQPHRNMELEVLARTRIENLNFSRLTSNVLR